jgi:hypothetical protein
MRAGGGGGGLPTSLAGLLLTGIRREGRYHAHSVMAAYARGVHARHGRKQV